MDIEILPDDWNIQGMLFKCVTFFVKKILGNNMEKIIKRNFEYYKNHVLGKYYVFTTNKNESIIVKTSPENLAHLLGIKYATQNGLFRYSGTRFFREMQVYKNGVPPFVGIYDLIDAEKDKKDILSQEELWCKNKNKIFMRHHQHVWVNVNQIV